ncbi:hypothetical protein [Micromonospora cathayae]|uniref:DUF488 domain-containing protein n=1 Tax=Micromonospora cathayae TaxID=3028804 RepID=A0ABY7ZLT8_9ACTN|nr:hypothetical protein [Micromonospora sp. HUAS 3]WDZ83977.1 hypothetical protein PVK37_26475 [Micromonospora sp. HUAS 3]
MTDLHLFTNRYQRFQPDQGAPVRTTVGKPRFGLPYDLAGFAQLLAPTYSMLKMAEGPYRHIYLERLEAHGVDLISEQFAEIADKAGTDRLVLLCFCDLNVPPPDNWCHRRMFAAWWEEQTNQEVPELDRPRQSPALTLF